uniref:Tumor protein p53 inducible protein 13 n=1 Tax=Hucho hucho TaxID=62062 RepID=A0A4W5Q6Q5_9TELE
MSPPVSTLLSGLCLCLVLSRAARPMWKACDNGKLLLGRDLPPPVVWSCPVISWPESTTQKIASIDTKYPPQRIEQVCMDTPITYNHTIPNSGAHRTVGAESGEYLYCPPQRWLNNLQHGATVLLYHPCAPVRQRDLLSVLGHFCLSDYIITPHPDLSKHRPLALVSWGRTLELSHVTTSEVCDWLQLTAAHGNRGDVDQSRQYNLLLTHPAGHKHAYPKQKSLRQCCEETLSLLDGWLEVTDWGRGRVRKSRAALRKEGKEKERRTTLDRTEPNRVQKHGTTLKPEAQGQATVRVTQGGTDRGLKVTQPRRRENDTNEKDPRGKVRETDWVNQNEAEDKRQSGKTGDIQEREVKSSRHEEETQPRNSPTKRKKPLSQSQPKHLAVTQANSQDRRADCDGKVGHCECTETVAPLGSAVAGPGDRMPPTPRTDEAVWAAAALGFLLVLLVLSVLHTRLYRHWRTTPSMYWHDPKQDYDRVADVIHRRMKMPGRRKRRASKSRRLECVLLPPSSSTEENE